MKELLNEWRKFLNENEDELEDAVDEFYYRIKSMKLVSSQTQEDPGIEYYKIEMSDGEILDGNYDPSSEKVIVYDNNGEKAGEAANEAALRYLNQDAPYDQERFPEDE